MKRDLSSIDILGVAVATATMDAAVDAVEAACDSGKTARLFYANAHTLNLAWRDPRYRAVLSDADLVLNDGAGVALAARLQGTRFPANLNGSDFNPRILELAARRGWPVFLLGAAPGVAKRSAQEMRKRIPSLHVCGTQHGYFDQQETESVVAAIRDSGAEVLMVALGNPLQELFIDEHIEATGARLGVGVGAFLDFTAGEVPRAPAWMNRLGIEWLYRLAREPGRLWRRYMVGNPVFLARLLRQRLRRARNEPLP